MSGRDSGESTSDARHGVKLRRASEADWPLLTSWIARADVQMIWGSPSAAVAEIRIVFESPSGIARIIEFDGRPIGYGHAIDATYWGEDLPSGIAAGTWDIDIVIAEPEHRGRGIGQAALDMLVGEVFSTTMALALCVIISVKNEPAIRAYEKAGFQWVRVLDDPIFGASWLLVLERPK